MERKQIKFNVVPIVNILVRHLYDYLCHTLYAQLILFQYYNINIIVYNISWSRYNIVGIMM